MDAAANDHLNTADGGRLGGIPSGPRIGEPQTLQTGRSTLVMGKRAQAPDTGVARPPATRPAQGEVTFTIRRMGFTPDRYTGSHVIITPAAPDPGQIPGGQRPLAPRRRTVRRIPGQWDEGTEVGP